MNLVERFIEIMRGTDMDEELSARIDKIEQDMKREREKNVRPGDTETSIRNDTTDT